MAAYASAGASAEDRRIATLNYECLLEIASTRAGVNYSRTPSRGQLALAKPHGSCNFLVDVNFKNVAIVGSDEMQNLIIGPLQQSPGNARVRRVDALAADVERERLRLEDVN